MSPIRIIMKNTAWLFVSQMINTVIGLLFITYIIRYLGADRYGVLGFALSLMAILGVLLDLGLNTMITREVSRDKAIAKKFVNNLIAAKLVMSFVLLAILFSVIQLSGMPQETSSTILIIAMSTICIAFTQIFYNVLQAYEKMEYQSLGSILNNVLLLGGALLIIARRMSVVEVAWIYFFASLGVLVYILIVYVWQFSLPRVEADIGFLKAMLREGFPYGIATFSGTIYYYVNSVILYPMQGNEAVGWFNTAYRLYLFILFVPQIFSIALFPAMSRLFISSKDTLRFTVEKYFKYMAIIGIPMGVGSTVIADKLIYTLFGSEYANSIPIFQILIWASVLIFLSSTFGCLANAANMQRAAMKVALVCAVASVLLNLCLIQFFSYLGAGLATLATELLSLLLYLHIINKIGYGLSRRTAISLVKISGAALVMGLLLVYLKPVNILLQVPTAMIIYFILLLIFGGIERDDLSILRNLFPKKTIENEKTIAR